MLVVDEEGQGLVWITLCYLFYTLEVGEWEVEICSLEGEKNCVKIVVIFSGFDIFEDCLVVVGGVEIGNSDEKLDKLVMSLSRKVCKMADSNSDNFLSQNPGAIDMCIILIEQILKYAIEISADDIFVDKLFDEYIDNGNIVSIDSHFKIGEDVIEIFEMQFADDKFDLFGVLLDVMIEVVIGGDDSECECGQVIYLWFVGVIHQVFYSAFVDEL